jgi:hypothetical protein
MAEIVKIYKEKESSLNWLDRFKGLLKDVEKIK